MRPRALAFAGLIALVCVLGAAGCGDDDDDVTSAVETAAAPATSAESAEAPTSTEEQPAAASTVERDAAVTVPLADVQEAEFEVGSPDYLAELDGQIWTKLDGGDLVAVDPETAREVKRVDGQHGPDDFCQGLGAGGGHLWSCKGADVERIDPATAKVVDTVPGAKIRDQGLMPFAEGRIWVLGGNGDQLVGIHAATGKPGEALVLPETCSEIGPGAGSTLWVVCGLKNAVLKVDVAAGEVVGRIDLPSPAVAWGTETDVWVGYAEGLARIDAESLQPTVTFRGLNPDLSGDLVVDGDDVWVRSPGGFLHRIDAATNTVAQHIEPSEPLSGGSVLVTPDAVWVSAYDDNKVLRLARD